MNRRTTALFAALESLLVVGIGVGVLLVPLTALWALQYDLQVEWAVFYRVAAVLWLVGHGADVRVTLDVAPWAGTAAAAEFTVTVAALGLALVTALLGARAGRRLRATDHPVVALVVSALTFAALATIVTATASSPLATVQPVQGVALPTLVFLIGMGLGAVLPTAEARRAAGSRPDPLERLRDRLEDAVPGNLVGGALLAARFGGMAVAALLALAALVVTVLLVLGYSTVITLYETLQSGALGGAALTIGQLSVLPNLVVWAASWLAGPGFSIGAGSSVSPLGTALGPVPALPVLGAIPTGALPFAFVGLAVPIAIGFLIGVLMRPAVVEEFPDTRPAVIAAVSAGAGAVAGLALGLLAWSSGGAAGPGRLGQVGPDPVVVGLVFAVETAVTVALGLVVAGTRRGSAPPADSP